MKPGGLGFILAQFVIFLYITLVELTSRKSVKSCVRGGIPGQDRDEGRMIISFWHNRIFHFSWLFRKSNGAIPISTHKDGMMIAGVARILGYRVISGSSNRNPLSVLTGMVKALEEGRNLGVTPDGPRGPRYSIQDGILYAAWKTGAPIIPASWSARHMKTFNSWDGFLFPLPFNEFHAVLGEPVYVRSRDEIPAMKALLKERMDLVTQEAEDSFKRR